MSLRYSLFIALLCLPLQVCQADEFDHYTNKVLQQVPKAKGAIKAAKLTPGLLAEYSSVIQGIEGTFLVVRTNEDRWAKLLVYPAEQKISKDKSLPMLLIKRFVTFKEGEERTILVEGKDICLFAGFQFNLDIGQVVPAEVPADIRFVAKDGKKHAEPVGQAEFYILTKSLPQAKPDASQPVVVGETFRPGYFNGVYKLYDDGRRSGTLHLKVIQNNAVAGCFYSDKDGRKYEVAGEVKDPHHKISFRITFPRTIQTFHGWMFTGNAKVFAGWAKMQNVESGFYAVRQVAKKLEHSKE